MSEYVQKVSGERGMLIVIAAACVAAALWLVASAGVDVVRVIQNTAIPFTLHLSAQPIELPAATAGPAHVVSTSTGTIDVVIGGFGLRMQIWLILSALVTRLCLALALGCLAHLIWRFRQGQPFGRATNRTFLIGSAAVLAAAIIGGTLTLWTSRGVIGSIFGADTTIVATGGLDFTLLFFGIALTLIATAFQIGERLQRDTEGLI